MSYLTNMQKQAEIQEQTKPFVLLKCRERDLDNILYPPRVEDNLRIRTIRGKRCTTPERFFQEAAAAFQFPYYFGENWSAFDECINDLSWVQANDYIFALTDLDKVLVKEDPKELETLFYLLDCAATSWSTGQNQWIPGTPNQEKNSFSIWLHMEQDAKVSDHLQSIIQNKNIPIISIDPLDDVA